MSDGFARLRSAVAENGQMAAGLYEPPALAVVTSYDPKAYAVKVQIQPPPAEGDAIETGWIPLLVLQSGAGFGVYAAPNIGDQIVVLFPGGDAQVGVCLGALPSEEDKPPTVPAGEIWLAHKTGSSIKLTTDGKIKSKGAWEHDGSIKATGDMTDNSGSNAVTVKDLRTKYNAHTHPVIALGSPSGPTSQPAT